LHDNSIIFQKNIQKFIHRDSTFIASIILLGGFFMEEFCLRKAKNVAGEKKRIE